MLSLLVGFYLVCLGSFAEIHEFEIVELCLRKIMFIVFRFKVLKR